MEGEWGCRRKAGVKEYGFGVELVLFVPGLFIVAFVWFKNQTAGILCK